MQDKEIDNLFRSKLEGMDVEPSAQLWSNIAPHIKAKGNGLKTYLSIAASLLILLSAGLYFINQPVTVIKKPIQIVKVKKQQPVKQPLQPQVTLPKAIQPMVENSIAKTALPVSRKHKVKKDIQKQILPARQLEVFKQPETQLAQVEPPVNTEVKFIVPDKEVPLVAKTVVPDDAQFKTNTDIPEQVPAAKTIAAASAKKHRIRNLGDLINVVVSKVDKRKDKLIEFSSSKDEDESVLSGLNLGFLKIKKDDK